ncbi:MAG TPA: serine/threonine-protein kinase [Vicinamibacteria bacterium]|nr:serine/threonine-protein kinase [Vicinamibacteria bacterium]
MRTSGTELSSEALAFRQRRVALFGLLSGGLGLIFLVYRSVVTAWSLRYRDLLHPSMGYHLLAVALSVALWLACRAGRRSGLFVQAAEAVGFVGCSVAYQLMGWYIPLAARPELIVLLALTYGVMARAVYVPSSGRRTLLLSLAIGAPLVAGTYVVYLGADAPTLEAARVHLRAGGAGQLALAEATSLGVWWTLTTILATATSTVIYGLRKEVREARKLGQYTLEEKLGEGGMGVVYRASHAMLRRPTAVKLLPVEKAGEQSVARFEREVQLTARLSHPNTVTIFDFGRTPEGVFYYAMELLDGAGLDAVVELDGPQPPERVLHVLHGVAGALAEAHEMGLIHRDIKPANIVLCRQGGAFDVPKVVDFGLVKDLSGAAVSLTADATITGTPLYMAPEAITAPEATDARSDLYALGAVGYFLHTGTHVFQGRSFVEVCSHHLHTTPEPPSARRGSAVPPDVERLLLDCLEKDPRRRPQTASELQERVVRCGAYGAWDRERARRWWVDNGGKLRRGSRPGPESVTPLRPPRLGGAP